MGLKHAKTLITGRPGVGKTTLVRKALEYLKPRQAAGFFTAEIREHGRRVGFQLEGLNGDRRTLSHVRIAGRYRVGKYGVDLVGFEDFLSELDLTAPGVTLAVIDEIGRMELLSGVFRHLVAELFNADKPLLATIALAGGGLLREIRQRQDVFLVEATLRNRDRLLGELLLDRRPAPDR